MRPLTLAPLVVALHSASVGAASLGPLLGDGSSADWWFTYKTNTLAYPNCSGTRECPFGGKVQAYPTGWGLQYLLASSVGGKTSALEQKSDCLGSGDDPVAKTFAQIYDGTAANYIIWNDQFYGDPELNVTPKCTTYCASPWGHSKGAIAWGSDGTGFVLQVTTPDWPGNGDKTKERSQQGNTLGCVGDDDAKVAQHMFALRLASSSDTQTVLQAMARASVATDPKNSMLMKLTDGPSDIASIARNLGRLDDSETVFSDTLSVAGVKVIAKPHSVNVPPWSLVSSVLSLPLRVASWFTSPKLISAKAGTPGCWASSLSEPQEVQTVLSGQWDNKTMGMLGESSLDGNHAKVAHSLSGTTSVFGDMNQEGSYQPSDRKCDSSQNGRGGMFFVLDDSVMHDGLKSLLTGDTAPYVGAGPSPGPSPSPRPPGPSPSDTCGGAGTRCSKTSGPDCVYVYQKDESACSVSKYGCYTKAKLPDGCPEKKDEIII